MGGSVTARIHVLITQGRFADAKALIAEATASGLLSRPHAAQLLDKVARLGSKDFSLATEAQLKLATKLLKETPRVMEKAR